LDERGEPSPLERFCAVLAEHGVEFIVVGGQAEALMGSSRVTYDVDLCYRRTSDNLGRLATALGTLNLTLRGAPPDLKFRLDAQALALGQNYTFEVDGEYPLDLLGYLEPIGVYDDLLPHAETVAIGGRPTLVTSVWTTSFASSDTSIGPRIANRSFSSKPSSACASRKGCGEPPPGRHPRRPPDRPG